MIGTSDIQGILAGGGTVVGTDGEKIGKVGQIFLDDRTGDAEWVTVSTGLFGKAESFVPLDRATVRGDEIVVPYDKAKIKDAPRVDDSDGHLSASEEAELYRYYGLDYGSDDDATGDVDTAGSRDDDVQGTVGHDTSGPSTDDAMTRSEERLHVGTERVTTGRARLRKYIVTEEETVTVPVTREEVRLEREPITDGNVDDALSGPDLTEEEHEVVLTEERAVVEKETVPVERVRLDTEVVSDTETVDETVRKEEIELDGDTGTTRGTGGL
ncbi:PRC and DUF2382 domain-containing protein [Cellulomonas shaoxiangyii]|uniref:DUF2382 domain-containing protein n=1 Tax=Cellulomonas shaoxiangyii TaxID=2566013 RepID=A0A4P7SR42_9CELL|nr:PRC and DUF2382 domain-containing protein [Cellulomonas shaoxiangyii]QCB95203.1 DUF2382 domain-containing protein [Cellulomonas shaoxiangyii]TGY84697.1 DUF2382 domain-containing protein [Cellulomonas shaoxiangyii]